MTRFIRLTRLLTRKLNTNQWKLFIFDKKGLFEVEINIF